MEKAKEPKTTSEHVSRSFWLWVGLLLPPLIWATHLQTIYLTSEYGCATSDFSWNHISSVVSLLLSLSGLFIAYREFAAAGPSLSEIDKPGAARRRFMAILGLCSGVLFSTLIMAQWLPTLLGVPCSK